MATITIEAESLTLAGDYKIENNGAAQGGGLISLLNGPTGTGTATISAAVAGIAPGTYTVRIVYFDEGDGDAQLRLTVGGTQIADFTLNENSDPTDDAPNAGNRTEKTFNNVTVNSGDLIEILGTAEQTEWSRVDFLEFVSVEVPPENQAPTAAADTDSTEENQTKKIAVLGNDSDPDGDTLTITAVDASTSNGTVVIDSTDQTVIYTPNAGFTGTDQFSYTISDGRQGTDTATVTITVNPAPGPTEPTEPTEPTDPTGPIVPTEPTEPTEPSAPPTLPGPTGPKLVKTDGNLLVLEDATGSKTAKFSLLNQANPGLLEVGIFKVDDANGSVDGSTPDDADYASKALKNATSIFATLGDDDINLALDRLINLEEQHLYSFYVIPGGSRDDFLADGLGSPKFGSTFGKSPLSYSFLEDEGAYILNWDLDGDEDFDDFGFKVDLADGETPPLGANLQGGQESEVIDLRGLAGNVKISVEVHREADYDNIVGFYQVDNLQGLIGDLKPGDPGYAQAAVRQWIENFDDLLLATDNGRTLKADFTVEAGKILVPFLVVNGTFEELTDSNLFNNPEVFFPFIGANSDGIDHVKLLGDNVFGFEDQLNGGDRDFDDLVVKLNVQTV